MRVVAMKLFYKQVQCFDIIQCAPEVFFRMRLQGYNWIKLLLMDHLKKRLERKVSLTEREMFIKKPVIVMNVDLADA